MKLTARDRWILALLPAVILLFGYQYLLANPQREKLKRLREQSNARPTGNTQAEFDKALAEADRFEAQLEAERKRKIDLTERKSGIPAEWSMQDRTRTLQELTRLCDANGVKVLSSSLQGSGTGTSTTGMPAVLRELSMALKKNHGLPEPQLWQLELSGAYAQITALLQQFAVAERFILPLELTMHLERDGAEPKWTVLLWI